MKAITGWVGGGWGYVSEPTCAAPSSPLCPPPPSLPLLPLASLMPPHGHHLAPHHLPHRLPASPPACPYRSAQWFAKDLTTDPATAYANAFLTIDEHAFPREAQLDSDDPFRRGWQVGTDGACGFAGFLGGVR